MLTHDKLREVATYLTQNGESYVVISTAQAIELCDAKQELENDLVSARREITDKRAEVERLHRIIDTDRRTLKEERYHARVYRDRCENFMLAFYEEADAEAVYRANGTHETWLRWDRARRALHEETEKMLGVTRARAKVMP